MLQKIKTIDEHADLYRDSKTGIAAVYVDGARHTIHPNISKTGTVRGMKKLRYWGREDRVVQMQGYKYDIDKISMDVEDKYDVICSRECMCDACKKRRKN